MATKNFYIRTIIGPLACFATLVVLVLMLGPRVEVEPPPAKNLAAPPDGQTLQASSHAEPRSPKWPKVRDEHLKVQPECQVCGSKLDPQVHHLVPFHDKPELELDPTNLVTLCGPKHLNHHLSFGHLGDFKCYNHHLKEWLKAIKDRKEE